MKDGPLTESHAMALISCVLILTTGTLAQEQSIDISGRWNSSTGKVYMIEVREGGFTWIVEGTEASGHGSIVGNKLEFSLLAEGREQVMPGWITELSPEGRAMTIEWSDGLVFTRESLPGEQQHPGDRPRRGTQVDIAGIWHSDSGLSYEMSQTGNNITWFLAGTHETAHGRIEGDLFIAIFPGQANRQEIAGRIVEIDPAGRAHFIEWDNGVVFAREAFPPHEIKRDRQLSQEAPPNPQPFESEYLQMPSSGPADKPETRSTILKRYDTPKLEKRIPSLGSPAPITGFKVLKKADYFALIEVDYNYNPPKGNPAFIYAEVYQDGGYKIGGSWDGNEGNRFPPGRKVSIPYATAGKAKLPVMIDLMKILNGMGGTPGNTSSSIVFYLGEDGVEKELEKEFKFNHSWGPDAVLTVSAKKTKISGISLPAFDVQVIMGRNYDRIAHFTSLNMGGRYVDVQVTPFLNGKVVGKAGKAKPSVWPLGGLKETPLMSTDIVVNSNKGTIDEVEVKLIYCCNTYGGKAFTYYKKKFKVSPQ